MSKPTTVVDKNWWQRICERPEIAEAAIGTLFKKATPVTPVALIEEVIANRFQQDRDEAVVARMIERLMSIKSGWIDEPSEIVFKEFIERMPIGNIGLPDYKANVFAEALSNPTNKSFNLETWMTERYTEKKRRRDVRKVLRDQLQRIVPTQLLAPPNLETYAHNSVSFLQLTVARPTTKVLMLRAYLGCEWDHQHSAETVAIAEAFSHLDYSELLKLPATHSYLLTSLLYDLARVAKIGLPQKRKSNPQILSGSAINDGEDQEYLASALLCDRLLTCDTNLHKMAKVFEEGGFWKGKCIFIPRDAPDRLEEYWQ